MKSAAAARLQVLIAATLLSTAGAAIKWSHMNAWQMASLRSGFAVISLLALNPGAWRGRWTKATPLVGCASAATMITFVTANKLTTSGATAFLQATNPIYMLALAPLILKERLKARNLVHMLFVAIGLALLFVDKQVPTNTAPDPHRGNMIAAFSGFCLALQFIGLRWLEKHPADRDAPSGMSAAGALISGNSMAFLFCLPFAWPLAGIGFTDWLVVAYLGLVQIGLSYSLISRSLHQLGAFEAALLLLMEPVLNPVWTWLIKGERPGPWAIAGGVVILTATLTKTALEAYLNNEQENEKFEG